jgi:hypothetical protein
MNERFDLIQYITNGRFELIKYTNGRFDFIDLKYECQIVLYP